MRLTRWLRCYSCSLSQKKTILPWYKRRREILAYVADKVFMHRKTFSLPLRKISHHTGIFCCRFSIPTAEFFPPCHSSHPHSINQENSHRCWRKIFRPILWEKNAVGVSTKTSSNYIGNYPSSVRASSDRELKIFPFLLVYTLEVEVDWNYVTTP